MSYSEKHKKRSVSPILRTTSEDRKGLYQNKDNYILYLEQQLEKATTVVHKKYEERVKNVEDILQDHEDKFDNFVKLIKLLQHFAESQESENSNIRNHINTSMEQLYNQELRQIKNQIQSIEQSLADIQQTSFREQPVVQEIEQTLNKKIDVIMDELRQTVMKSDIKAIESRVQKLELPQPAQFHPNQNQNVALNQQLQDLKIVVDSLIQDQESLKQNLNKVQSSQSTLPSRLKVSRQDIIRESQISENEVMRPMRSKVKSISKESRSESRQNRIENVKKKKKEQVKELIKKNKQVTPRKK